MVHFVSAGPGAPDLITVRGKQLLEEADVVIYAGSLVNPELLNLTKPGCRIFNSAYMALEDVICEIKAAEAEGKTTVRLHTGDTTLYSTIREQIKAIEQEQIPYDVTPGVSAFQAASASIHAELTLPGISQSVILTRAGGRTKVPDRETIRSFAAHGTTMALYLSSSLAEEVRRELLEGGYPKETPVVIVYKASWPEERIVHSTIEQFPEAMAREEINRTAVILIGEVLRGLEGNENAAVNLHHGELSKLYDPAFTTGYRKAKQRTVWMCACTEKAADRMKQLVKLWQEREADMAFETHIKCKSHPEHEAASMKELVKQAFDRVDVMVFFSASGIAVRSIAPFVKSKVTDPAVLVVDELGQYCIPLLSGHIGGANAYAKTVSELIAAVPVITTATDLEEKFSVDSFAKKNHLSLSDLKIALTISSRIIAGEELALYSERIIEGAVPEGIHLTSSREDADIVITGANEMTEAQTSPDGTRAQLFLRNEQLAVGIGCRRGIEADRILNALDETLAKHGFGRQNVAAIGSIDLKQNETGLLNVIDMFHVKHEFFTAEELLAVKGTFSSSAFVEQTTGVDCVCERAAVLLACGKVVISKTVCDGVTIAAAEMQEVLHF